MIHEKRYQAREQVAGVIEEIMPILISHARETKAEISCRIDPAAYTYCDRVQLQQVILNLARNAMEAPPNGVPRRVEISGRQTSQGYQILVSDNGPGVPADMAGAGQAQREVVGLAPGEKTFATSKLFFSYSLEHGFLGPLATGATAILEPDWPDAETALERVERHHPAAFFSVPTFYRRLLALGAARLAAFRNVRRFVAAGEKLPAQLLEQWREATGGEILSLYGMSETFCACIVTPPGTSNGSRTGKPLAGVDTRLVTAEGKNAGVGEAAELWLRHPALALGYANRPEQTAAQFRDGWFCTRDLFVKDPEGFFSHRGRSDELVKIAGQWVQPGELEEAVAGDPAISEVACVQVTDTEGFERLAMFVATRGKAADALAAAGRVCEEKLPRFKRPKWIRAVAELPRTATGKIQRFKLRELLERELEDGN